MSERKTSDLLRTTLARLAPGTALRDGLERILRGRTGGLIVLGHDDLVEAICDGGFHLDVAFSATRLRELSKMDGAVVLSTDARRILRANVQLVPDPKIPTEESGTRHRASERTAIQTGHPIVSVSQSMSLISVYVDSKRHVMIDSATILSRANQALATLERYKARLDEVAQSLSTLEIEDFVTLKDAIPVMQRLEMVRRISDEIDMHVIELGTDGRLITLQLDELVGGIDADRELLIRDYLPPHEAPSVHQVCAALDELDAVELLDVAAVAKAFGYAGTPDALDRQLSPRGHRQLARVPRLSLALRHKLVDHFGSLQALLAAPADELQVVDELTEANARLLREGLSRLAESSIMDHFG